MKAAMMLLAVAATSLGCGLVVGNGDYAIGQAEPDATGSGGGPGGNSGLAAHDATSTEAALDVSVGSGGDVGAERETEAARSETDDAASEAHGADATTGADATADADASMSSEDGPSAESGDAAPLICGQGLPAGQAGFDQIVSTCVLAVSCDPIPFIRNIGTCITQNFLHSNGYYSCLSSIQDCNGYFQCQGQRIPTSADCPATAAAVRCDSTNNLAIDCNSNYPRVTSCAKSGGTCGTYSDGTGTPHAECIVVPTCVETDGLPHCGSNGQIYTCRGGVGYGISCTLANATCNDFGDGPGCYFNGPACSASAYTCIGGGLNWCRPDSHRQFTYDCSSAGLSCSASSDGGIGTCLAPGCASLAACPAVESCGTDGKTLTVCVGGAPYAIDCTKQGQPGFAGCATFQDATGLTYGYCY